MSTQKWQIEISAMWYIIHDMWIKGDKKYIFVKISFLIFFKEYLQVTKYV